MQLSKKQETRLRLRVLEYFENSNITWNIAEQEPFKSDIRSKRYTALQLKKMMQSMATAGVLKYPPDTRTNARVYALTNAGKLLLQELREAGLQPTAPPNSSA